MCRDRHKLKSDSADQTRVPPNMAEVRPRQTNTVTLSTEVRIARLEGAQVPEHRRKQMLVDQVSQPE